MAMQMCNKRVTHVAINLVRQLAKPISTKVEDDHHGDKHIHSATPTPKSFVSMNKHLLRRNASITTRLSTSLSIRHAHTDIPVPNFDYYRHKTRLDASKSYRDTGDTTSPYSYLTPIAFAITSAYMTKYIIQDISAYIGPTNDAMTSLVEINLDTIPEGKNAVFEWCNKPVYVRHRTSKEIAREEGVNVSQLRDPQKDSERVKKPEWLIVIGLCTHLCYLLIANAGDFGGYYCPAHGAHYDASGRTRKGPAPFNLEIPPYVFKNERTVIIGVNILFPSL